MVKSEPNRAKVSHNGNLWAVFEDGSEVRIGQVSQWGRNDWRANLDDGREFRSTGMRRLVAEYIEPHMRANIACVDEDAINE